MPKGTGHPKQNLDFTFILKLNKQDRQMLDDIQISGINASELFRKYIREQHKKIINVNE